jgi:tetratricopeptide (TPR) repeat protein
VRNDPGRFASLSSNNRLAWWGEARDVFEADPVAGAGANTFDVARKRYRDLASSVTQPHSVPLQFLAGTGIVGLVLLLGLVAAAAVAAVAAVRRHRGTERDAAAALAVALALWLVHALVDYDWDFVAVTGTAFFSAGALAAAGAPARVVRSPFGAVAAITLALAACASVATPWLARQEVLDVNPALERGDVEEARDAAKLARSLDPLSLDPLFARARVEEDAGRPAAALGAYARAAELQPDNPVPWYELGLYEFSRGDRCSAYVHLNRSYTLDPAGLQWARGSQLDQAREWVNEGNC